MDPILFRMGPPHTSCVAIWPCLNGSLHSGSTLGATHSPPWTVEALLHHYRGHTEGYMGTSSTVPSLIASELPTLHQPHYQILSVHHDDLTIVSTGALLPAPGVWWEQLTGIPFGLDLNWNQIDLPVWTTPINDEWGGHWNPGWY